jgi:hypothetical protein
MTSIVAIEFCAATYKTEKVCYGWLMANGWSDLMRVKGFSLRRNNQAKVLTNERKRKVFQFSQGLGNHTSLEISRPESTIVIITAGGSRFPATSFPALLPATVEKERKKKEDHERRVAAARAERAEKAKLLPPKEKSSKKSKKRKTTSAAAFLADCETAYGIKVGGASE